MILIIRVHLQPAIDEVCLFVLALLLLARLAGAPSRQLLSCIAYPALNTLHGSVAWAGTACRSTARLSGMVPAALCNKNDLSQEPDGNQTT